MIGEGVEETIFAQVQGLLDQVMANATGLSSDNQEYRRLRGAILADPRTRGLAPSFLKSCRDLGAFWSFIKNQFATYEERRQFLRQEFEPCLSATDPLDCANVTIPLDPSLARMDSDLVRIEWAKALVRQDTDPSGAITMARTFLESVCKHILHSFGVETNEKVDLPTLFQQTTEKLNLAPTQHSEKAFKIILGGCVSVVNGLAEVRNKLGDSHGSRVGTVRARPRHARLAVNAAGSIALFLFETWEARQADAAAGKPGS